MLIRYKGELPQGLTIKRLDFPGCAASTTEMPLPYVLDRADAVADEEIAAWLTSHEAQRALTIQHVGRRAEHVRSRWLISRLLGTPWTASATTNGEDEIETENAAAPANHARAPAWPPGIVGSLTHKNGHVGIVLATAEKSASASSSIGLDMESAATFPVAVGRRVFSDGERAVLELHGSAQRWQGPVALACGFAFKEAAYKAIYPFVRRYVDFLEIEIVRISAAEIFARPVIADGAKVILGETPGGTDLMEFRELVGAYALVRMSDGPYVVVLVTATRAS